MLVTCKNRPAKVDQPKDYLNPGKEKVNEISPGLRCRWVYRFPSRKRLKREGYWVRGVDLKFPRFAETEADDFLQADLRSMQVCNSVVDRRFDEVWQLAADNPNLEENSAYPAAPDSEYGWEKLFSERMYLSYGRNYGMDVRVARYHNIFGPEGSWNDGKEKAPAAICRKVAEAPDGGEIEIWGDGLQTRSFLFINECLEGSTRLTRSDWTGPVNIGSDEMVSINQLAQMVMEVAGKKLTIRNIPGPLGVRGRNSDNRLIAKKLGWAPSQPLLEGLEKTYQWIEAQVCAKGEDQTGSPVRSFR